MTWPVNWIEQAAYYNQLKKQINLLKAQARPVTVHSYREPTQKQWEDAYAAQAGEVPPIAPGVRLFWYDMKNGTVKPYSTVWKTDNATIDPAVRPAVSQTAPRSCFRFLGTRQMQDLSIFQPVLSPLRKTNRGIFVDLETLIKKNLLAVVIHYRMHPPVLLNLYELNDTDFSYWGDTSRSFGLTRARGLSGATSDVSTIRIPGTAALPQLTTWYAISQFTDTTGGGVENIVSTEYNHGWLVIMGLGPDFANDQQAFSTSTNYVGLGGAVQAANPTQQVWLAAGMKHDGVGARGVMFGRALQPSLYYAEHAYLYGIFADDPGPLEIYNAE